MTPSETPVPAIRNAGTRPAVGRKLFVNIPVADLQRSIHFFEALGFTFDPRFTDASATAMLVGEDASFMLLQRERFASFIRQPVGDPRADTQALLALGVESREAVDVMVQQAIAAGGAHAMEPVDHGFMYGWSFRDLDGHHWEVFWMDPAAVAG